MEFNVPETLHRAIRKAIAITHNGLAKKRSHLITLQIGTILYWLCFLAVVVCC